jgi:chemotaxis protein MotB
MKKKHEGEHDNSERWLLTYSDLITLMMAFFVILFAMASVDVNKFKQLAASLNMAFNVGKASGGTNMLTDFSGAGLKPDATGTENSDFKRIINSVNDYTAEKKISQSVHTMVDERGLVINLADTLLFDSGRAELSTDAMLLLEKLAEILEPGNRLIRVEGHTDNMPISTARYQSNWQLSTDRATNVIMFWITKHPDLNSRLSAAGYGEFHPVASNDKQEDRARNRRVDIVVMNGKQAKLEP